MSGTDSRNARRLREWASLTGDRLPEDYRPVAEFDRDA